MPSGDSSGTLTSIALILSGSAALITAIGGAVVKVTNALSKRPPRNPPTESEPDDGDDDE